MKIKTITISSKGQIALPIEMRRQAGISEGEQVLILQDGDRIMLRKLTFLAKEKEKFKKLLKSETFQLMLLSEKSLAKDWENKYDARWDAI